MNKAIFEYFAKNHDLLLTVYETKEIEEMIIKHHVNECKKCTLRDFFKWLFMLKN